MHVLRLTCSLHREKAPRKIGLSTFGGHIPVLTVVIINLYSTFWNYVKHLPSNTGTPSRSATTIPSNPSTLNNISAYFLIQSFTSLTWEAVFERKLLVPTHIKEKIVNVVPRLSIVTYLSHLSR